MVCRCLDIEEDESLSIIVDRLLSGDPVALPTETVYGLAARADDIEAISRIYHMKNRPSNNPLILHCSNSAMAWRFVEQNHLAISLAQDFWPGPLTLVLNKRKRSYLASEVSAGLDSLAVRVPQSEKTRLIIEKTGCPLAMPSANLSGRLSATSAQHVMQNFQSQDLLVADGGQCKIGIESTVIDLRNNQIVILRDGGISRESLKKWAKKWQKKWGEIKEFSSENDLENSQTSSQATPQLSPGMLSSHYAPSLPLRKDVSSPRANEAFLGFGDMNCHKNLSRSGDLREAARNLFQYLYELDRESYDSIAVAPIPKVGLGVAINDRLSRATSPRVIS